MAWLITAAPLPSRARRVPTADSTAASPWSPPVAVAGGPGRLALGSIAPTADCQSSSTVRYPSLVRTSLIDARISGGSAAGGTVTPLPHRVGRDGIGEPDLLVARPARLMGDGETGPRDPGRRAGVYEVQDVGHGGLRGGGDQILVTDQGAAVGILLAESQDG